MEEHYQMRHAPIPKAPEPMKVKIYDRFGNPIKHKEV